MNELSEDKSMSKDWVGLPAAKDVSEYNTTISIQMRATHFRGKYIHSHKGKNKRQHRFRNSYIKNITTLHGCYPTSVTGMVDANGVSTIELHEPNSTYNAKFKFDYAEKL